MSFEIKSAAILLLEILENVSLDTFAWSGKCLLPSSSIVINIFRSHALFDIL
jgi:hypothetical protein